MENAFLQIYSDDNAGSLNSNEVLSALNLPEDIFFGSSPRQVSTFSRRSVLVFHHFGRFSSRASNFRIRNIRLNRKLKSTLALETHKESNMLEKKFKEKRIYNDDGSVTKIHATIFLKE